MGDDGKIVPKWVEVEKESCITFAGKEKHTHDIMGAVAKELKSIRRIQEKKGKWDRIKIPRVQMPSLESAKL